MCPRPEVTVVSPYEGNEFGKFGVGGVVKRSKFLHTQKFPQRPTLKTEVVI